MGKRPQPLNQPPRRLGQLIKLFREAGISGIEMHWLEAPLDEFKRLLRESGGFDAARLVSWTETLRYARPHDGLRLLRPAAAGYRLRLEDGPPATPLDRFRIDERVYVQLEVPEELLDEGEVFATVVNEAWHETACLFPLEEADSGKIAGSILRLPAGERNYQISGPVGGQRVHALLSTMRPAAPVHAGLEPNWPVGRRVVGGCCRSPMR
jgi:hypothetical protein